MRHRHSQVTPVDKVRRIVKRLKLSRAWEVGSGVDQVAAGLEPTVVVSTSFATGHAGSGAGGMTGYSDTSPRSTDADIAAIEDALRKAGFRTSTSRKFWGASVTAR